MRDATPYSRRVSFSERLYLVEDQLRPGFCIQIVVEGEGQLSVEALEGAVARAAEANPGARLILRGILGWTRWVARGPIPPVRVFPSWGEGERPAPEIERPLSPTRGPTCEVVLAPGVHTHVVFRCFHGVMDARGLLHFAEDVFRALRGEALVGADCTLNDTDAIPLGIAAVSSTDAAEVVVSAPEGLMSEAQLAELCDALERAVTADDSKSD